MTAPYSEIIYGGFRLILAMSTEYFQFFLPRLVIDLDYDHSLRLLSRQFAENAIPAMGLATPMVEVSNEDFDKAKFLSLWQELFDGFVSIGCANDVCHTILTLDRDNKLAGKKLTSHWNNLLVSWSLYNSNRLIESLTLRSLQLPETLIKDIKILVLQKTFWDKHSFVPYSDKADAWDQYIMDKRGIENWFQLRVRIARILMFWANIFKLLSDDQLEVFDTWGHDNIKNNYQTDTYFSLVSFKSELKETGYI